MLSGAATAAIIWLAAAFPGVETPQDTKSPQVVAQALENIYYVQVDGMT